MTEDNSITNSYEAMEKELKEAGYNISLTDFHVRYESFVATPDGWSFSPNVEIEDSWAVSDNERIAVIDKAWKHYKREKRYQAMRQLLAEMLADADSGILIRGYKDRISQLLESMKSDVK